MSASRRAFLERLSTTAAGAALLGATPSALHAMPLAHEAPEANTSASAFRSRHTEGPWDLSWTERLKGKYKVVADSPDIEGGAGVMRASVWSMGYAEAMGTSLAECSTVLVLRHAGIVLAMQSAYWAEYNIGEKKKVKGMDGKTATKNPALINSATDGTPKEFDEAALDKFIARGGIALGCGLAFDDIVETIKGQDKVSDAAAKEKAMKLLVPGVILQPSGAFAVVRAQQAGCWFLRAS